jgi:hypothetical protein
MFFLALGFPQEERKVDEEEERKLIPTYQIATI